MAAKKKVYKDYQDYLNSPEWAKLREQAHNRVRKEFNNDVVECEICGACQDKIHNKDNEYYGFFNGYFDDIENRSQFIRQYHHCIQENYIEEHNILKIDCDDFEAIILNALKDSKIHFQSDLRKKYNGGFHWVTHLCGISLIPPVEGRLIHKMKELSKKEE